AQPRQDSSRGPAGWPPGRPRLRRRSGIPRAPGGPSSPDERSRDRQLEGLAAARWVSTRYRESQLVAAAEESPEGTAWRSVLFAGHSHEISLARAADMLNPENPQIGRGKLSKKEASNTHSG